MEDDKTWQVIITNQLDDDQDANRVVEKLAALFKTEPAKAAQLISKPRSIVKEQVDEATAKKYLAAIGKTGAHCEIINTAEADLPQIMEPVKPPARADEGLIRAAAENRPARDPELAMVEKDRRQAKDTREKLARFGNADSRLFCPECGSIRSTADAICLNCGYDPALQAEQRAGVKRIVYVGIILIVLIVGAAFLAMPLYQQYAKQVQLENGLQLAIDTRNQITRFILDTNFWPNQNIDANLPKNLSNDVIESIQLTGNGAFTVTLREQITGQPNQTIIFKPNELQGKLVWNCMGGTLDNAYRPEICKGR
jgi:type IV pilus assembly protein PilA